VAAIWSSPEAATTHPFALSAQGRLQAGTLGKIQKLKRNGEYKLQKGKMIGQGRTAEIFEWGEHSVLKLYRGGFPKTAIENEFKIGGELYQKGIPVPEVDELIEMDGRSGIIFERVTGQTMMKLVSAKPWKIVGEAQKLAELHKAIQINVDASIPSYKLYIKESISESKLLNEKIKKGLLEKLENLPDGSVLCHGDFHPDNIIISREKVVVIDWTTAAKGDPLSDIARTSTIFKYGAVPEHKSRIEASIINFFRTKFFSEYIKHYLRITGMNRELIEQWELPLAAARLKEWIPQKEKEELLDFVTAHFA
jgi:uncharacterized protein (TIGR02172 family)